MYLNNFKPGQKVLFIPDRALGNPNHPDIEQGVVEEVTRDKVRIRFPRYSQKIDKRFVEAVGA